MCLQLWRNVYHQRGNEAAISLSGRVRKTTPCLDSNRRILCNGCESRRTDICMLLSFLPASTTTELQRSPRSLLLVGCHVYSFGRAEDVDSDTLQTSARQSSCIMMGPYFLPGIGECRHRACSKSISEHGARSHDPKCSLLSS